MDLVIYLNEDKKVTARVGELSSLKGVRRLEGLRLPDITLPGLMRLGTTDQVSFFLSSPITAVIRHFNFKNGGDTRRCFIRALALNLIMARAFISLDRVTYFKDVQRVDEIWKDYIDFNTGHSFRLWLQEHGKSMPYVYYDRTIESYRKSQAMARSMLEMGESQEMSIGSSIL